MSHWSVASVATVKLIIGAFDEVKNDPTIGRAEALRRVEMAMLDPKSLPEFAHPLVWAPFVLAGEGGAGRKDRPARSEMAIRGIPAGGLRRSSLVRQTAGYGASRPLTSAPARVALENRQQARSELGTFFNIRV